MRSYNRRLSASMLIMVVVSVATPALPQTFQDAENCQKRKNNPDEIIRVCSLFIDKRIWSPGGQPVPPVVLSLSLQYRGQAFLAKDDIDRALKDYEQALLFDPTSISAYELRGSALAANGELDRAISDYSRGIALAKGERAASLLLKRGVMHMDKRNFTAALADVEQSLGLNPKVADAYYQRGKLKATNGDASGASADYAKAVQLNPDGRKWYDEQRIQTENWLSYLEEIQTDHDHSNWSGPPLDFHRGRR